jgi:two-component system cell cycle sensor histidine kinase/response regulator CckA
VGEPVTTWSPELYRIYGLTPDTYTPSYEGYLARVHPDDRGFVRASIEHMFTNPAPVEHDERVMRPDGSIRYLHTCTRVILNDQGTVQKLIGVCQDITDRKLVENTLAEQNELLRREILERERIEARLLQTHKLEAIGRLAGGIAHDFNNLLGVVIGRASLLQSRLPTDDPMRAHLEEITTVGKHAARLTQQLLAFSREQTIRREKLDLGRVVVDLERLLRRLISENIELVTTTDREPCLIEADRSQIEQVVMNLVVNARDAMPRGGRITVETKAIPRGTSVAIDPRVGRLQRMLPEELDPTVAHVALSVSDTGVGMDGATLDRIFDPYFTTKDEGKGTGLGLSTVYGVVKQSGGAISVESGPNEGSRFTIYLPLADSAGEVEESEVESDAKGGHERILLVEDQAPLRLMLRQILEDKGYTVLEAEAPGEALRMTEEMKSKIALLVTDIVMPRMSGSELGERVREIDPRIRVLHISGHADDALLNQEVLDRGGTILRKPFTSHELARAVRAAIDAKS